MRTIRDHFGRLRDVIAGIREAARYVRTLLWTLVGPRARLAARLLAAESQLGMCQVRIAYRSPWQNPYIERFVGTLRRELLDHVIVLSQSHLNRLLREFIEEYYHAGRPHQGLTGNTPIATQQPKYFAEPSKLMSLPVCGGLHYRYVRVAA